MYLDTYHRSTSFVENHFCVHVIMLHFKVCVVSQSHNVLNLWSDVGTPQCLGLLRTGAAMGSGVGNHL